MRKKTYVTIPLLAWLLILVASPALGTTAGWSAARTDAEVATERTLDLSSWFQELLAGIGQALSISRTVPEARPTLDSVKGRAPDAPSSTDPEIVIRPMADPVGDPDG